MRKQTPHFTDSGQKSRCFPGQKTIAVYARVDGDDPFMLKAQADELCAYAAGQPDFTGWNIVVYQETEDVHKSGRHPQFEQLTADIRAGLVHCVIIKNLSRIARDQVALMHYIEHVFFLNKVRLISLTENFDTDDPHTLSALQNPD